MEHDGSALLTVAGKVRALTVEAGRGYMRLCGLAGGLGHDFAGGRDIGGAGHHAHARARESTAPWHMLRIRWGIRGRR